MYVVLSQGILSVAQSNKKVIKQDSMKKDA